MKAGGQAKVLMDRHAAHNRPMVLVVLGGGSGETTVCKQLAERLGCHCQEGVSLHLPENVAKMRGGAPLSDADRGPWVAPHRCQDRRVARPQ